MPILTIAIPTYNRIKYIRPLVEHIIIESASELGRTVQVFISDNSSTDGTSDYLATLNGIPGIAWRSNKINLGATLNIVEMLELCETNYIWILGDDDLPMKGCLDAVLNQIVLCQPNMIYMPAKWTRELPADLQRTTPAKCEFTQGRPEDLAFASSVYITFLSSWIIDLNKYNVAYKNRLRRCSDSALPQLEWNLGLISTPGVFLWGRNPLLWAKAGNSGGYKVFELFCSQYTDIVSKDTRLSPRLMKFYRQVVLRGLLPGLIWDTRMKKSGRFCGGDLVELWPKLFANHPDQKNYIHLLSLIANAPLPIAWFAKNLAQSISKFWLKTFQIKSIA